MQKKAKLSYEGCSVHSEQASLLKTSLTDTLATGNVNIVLVGGSSGTGKTHLIHSSFSNQTSKCWFATAKFDQRGDCAPLAVVTDLFSEIIRLIIGSEPGKRNVCCSALQSAFSTSPRHKEMMLDFIPTTAELLEDSPSSTAKRKGKDGAQDRIFSKDDINSLRLALRTLLRAVASEQPLILCLDDVMWSDADTLEIFRFLLADANLTNVLFCATYRDNEVDEAHSFTQWKMQLEEELEQGVQTTILKSLQVTEIQSFLSASLRLDQHRLTDLANLLHQRTDGNLFHLIQMLENMWKMDLLKYEYVGYQWTYSLFDIERSTGLGDNVGELVSSRIQQLEPPVQEVIKLAACFGARVEVRALEIVQPVMLSNIDDVRPLLDRACQEMMIIRASENCYKFAHDQIQAAAYAFLSSSNEAKEIHRRMGQILLHYPETLQEQTLMFACAAQLKRGGDFDKTAEDRIAIAKLGLAAGKKAAAISAFLMASDFFKLGIDALGGTLGFDLHHDLAIELFSLYAKTEQCGGSISESKKSAETILEHVTTEENKATAYRTLLSCFLASNQLDELLSFGLELCEKLGEKIPRDPKPKKLNKEVTKMRKLLLKKSNADILSLPPIMDKDKELCMNVLYELAMPAYYVGNHPLHYAIVNRMNTITLSHGLSKWSPRSFALSGQHLTANHHDFKEGYRLAQLALVLLGDYKVTKQGGNVVYTVAIIKACIEPAASCLDLLLTGYKISMESGHIDAAVSSIFNYFWTFFYSGLPFKSLLDDIGRFSTQILDYKRHYMFLMVLPVWQCLLCLRGQSEDPSNMEVGVAIEKESLVGGNPKGAGKQTLMSYWMQVSFYIGNYKKATEIYEQLKGCDMGAFKATMFFNARMFFFALIEIHNFRVTKKTKCRKSAKEYRDLLRKHVSGGAINLVHKVQLLDAEIIKRTSKNSTEILQKYNAAIVSATRAGFIQDAALSNYLCAQYCLTDSELSSNYEIYLRKSHELFITWGAFEVAKSLRKRHPGVLDIRMASDRDRSSSVLSVERFSSASSLEARHRASYGDIE